MSEEDTRHRHSEVSLAGFRAHAAAVGLIQLIRELRDADVLDNAAVTRIRDAILDEFVLGRPLSASKEAFADRLRARLDRLLHSPPRSP